MPNNQIWKFKTRRFIVVLDWDYEDAPDISWDDTGEVAAKITSGEWTNFCFAVRVFFDDQEIACNYLGNSIYADPAEFRDHIGARGRYGSYFSDMVRQGVDEARRYLCGIPKLRCAP